MFILAFIPMLLVAIAYRDLNRAAPDCGTTFTWGTKAFGPIVGWLGGWGLAVSAIIVWRMWQRSRPSTRCAFSVWMISPRTP